MNAAGYFVVTSGVQNPALFSSNFTTPIELDQNFEIGLQSISHGPLFNITIENNKIVIIRTVPGGEEDINFIFFSNSSHFLLISSDLIYLSPDISTGVTKSSC